MNKATVWGFQGCMDPRHTPGRRAAVAGPKPEEAKSHGSYTDLGVAWKFVPGGIFFITGPSERVLVQENASPEVLQAWKEGASPSSASAFLLCLAGARRQDLWVVKVPYGPNHHFTHGLAWYCAPEDADAVCAVLLPWAYKRLLGLLPRAEAEADALANAAWQVSRLLTKPTSADVLMVAGALAAAGRGEDATRYFRGTLKSERAGGHRGCPPWATSFEAAGSPTAPASTPPGQHAHRPQPPETPPRGGGSLPPSGRRPRK